MWTTSPLARAVIEKLARQSHTYISISAAEQRIIDVLFDESAVVRGAQFLLPMPKSAELRAVAEKWQQRIEDMAGLDDLFAVGTQLPAAPRTDPYVRNYRIRLLPRVSDAKRSSG